MGDGVSQQVFKLGEACKLACMLTGACHCACVHGDASVRYTLSCSVHGDAAVRLCVRRRCVCAYDHARVGEWERETRAQQESDELATSQARNLSSERSG